MLFLSLIGHTQINSSTPNKLFTLPGTPVFYMPTATDVISYNAVPMQVVVSSAPGPILHFDNYSGSAGNVPVISFGSSTVFLDDVSLAQNGTIIYAYITCRVLNGSNVSMYLLTYKWIIGSNTFTQQAAPLLLDTRSLASSTDPFDRVSVDASKNLLSTPTPANEIEITWQKNSSIYLRKGAINFSSGSIGASAASLLFQSGSSQFPGVFSCPDAICYSEGGGAADKRVISVLYKYAATQKILVTFNDDINSPAHPYSTAVITAYTVTGTNKVLRTPRVDMPYKYYYAVCFNEYDIITKKSEIKLVANPQGETSMAPVVLNAGLDGNCTNNFYYKYTGFPNIKFISVNIPQAVNLFEVVWQQVMPLTTPACTDFCTVNAISRRLQWNGSTGAITSPSPPSTIGTQYLHINQNLSLNSFYPCVATLQNQCKNFYSFGLMDKNTNANGKVGYKQVGCNANSLRPAGNIAIQLINTISKDRIYPNPVKNLLIFNPENTHGIINGEIINAMGVHIKKNIFYGGKINEISVEDLADGVYYLRTYSTESGINMMRFVVIH